MKLFKKGRRIVHYHQQVKLIEKLIEVDWPTRMLLVFLPILLKQINYETSEGEEMVMYPVPACRTHPGPNNIAPWEVLPCKTRFSPNSSYNVNFIPYLNTCKISTFPIPFCNVKQVPSFFNTFLMSLAKDLVLYDLSNNKTYIIKVK